MSINKNALIRYQTLDRCFRNPGRMYFIEDLLEECNNALYEFNPDNAGIQRRQLYDDIKFMESDTGWSIPLERYRHGRRTYYRYSNTSFSINDEPLNIQEVEQINAALQIISRFFGTPQFEWVHEMTPRLESKFGLINHKKEIIGFESNVDLIGREYIRPLFNAILNKRVLCVTYQDFKSDASYDIIFHPYYLKQFNNRWFTFGLNEANSELYWNMALDRIIHIKELDKKYVPSDNDWEDYFYDIIGVTRPIDGKVEEIKLLFDKEIAPYVITKPIHPSQKHITTEKGLEVRIKVIPNFELEKLILSFGEQVKIISPIDFKHRIAVRIIAMQRIYFK